MALWKFGQPRNKQGMMAIYCKGQAVGGIVFYKHQLQFIEKRWPNATKMGLWLRPSKILVFALSFFFAKNVILGLLNCNTPGAFIRIVVW